MLNFIYKLNYTIAFLLCSVLSSKSANERDIYVSPKRNDSSDCSEKARCKTLDRALRLASGINSTRILVGKGNYLLKTSHSFTRIISFGLYGMSSSRDDVQITCEPNVGLSFTLSGNITFDGVKFQKCGGWRRSSVGVKKYYPGLKGAKLQVALDFRYCRNLRMCNVEVSSSLGLAANLYDVGGLVNFTDSLFADNFASNESVTLRSEYVSENTKYVYSGGGVFLILNSYGYDTVSVTHSEHDSYQHNNSYEFINCHFIRNEALWLNEKEENKLNTPERPFSRGGGLTVHLTGNASGCVIKIQSCVFTGNKASWGGGLQVELTGKTQNNYLIMKATEFKENVALLSGGGARLGNLPLKRAQRRINRFKMINCSFVNNKALWGGGTSLYGITIPRKCAKQTDSAVTQFFFYGCSWLENTGSVGAAMGAYLYHHNYNHENEDFIGLEIPYRVCFQNDTLFRFNEVVPLHRNLTIGQGTLYSVQVPLIFQRNAKFVSNSQSALVLDGSTVEVHGRLEFINNTGVRGGAIAMYGRSRIVLYENTSKLAFEANKCDDKGGALYIQAPGPPLVSFNATGSDNQACFFGYLNSSKDYDEWNTTVIFKDNIASLGKSVYATTLKNCRRAGESRQQNKVLKWSFVKFENPTQNVSTSLLQEVATDPVEIRHNKTDWEVAPGEVFNATVQLFDEVGNPVPGIVNVSIKSSSVRLINPSSLFLATDGKIEHIGLRGEKGIVFSVRLSYIGSQLLEKLLDNVTLTNCHAGFRFSNKTLICECLSATDRGVSHCGDDKKTVYIKGGYWAGNVGGKFATYFCPIGYCNSSTSNDYQYFEGHVCKDSRNQKSILCGECRENYSISFGSEHCLNTCTYWHLFYVVPFGLGLLLIVITVMLIDLDFCTGHLNAWLYSYQVIKLLTPDGFEFDPFIEFVIAFTNVHIRIGKYSFCLAEGLDDADKLMLMYTIPTYVLLVVALLTWLVGRYPNWSLSRKVLKSTPSAPFRAVCTILVFCYADITRISLKILDPAKVGSKTILYDYGEVEFFHGKHRVYGIVAIMYIVIFVLPFPLILLFRPFLARGLRPVLNLNRWGPFFDAFQSCFKDQYRWCAAFYFLCRLGILLIYTYMPASSTKRIVLEGACILILVIFASLRPYKEVSHVNPNENSYGWINRSDLALLTTLSLIAAISTSIESCGATTPNEKRVLKMVLKTLAYVPLLVLLLLGYQRLKTYCMARTFDKPNWWTSWLFQKRGRRVKLRSTVKKFS